VNDPVALLSGRHRSSEPLFATVSGVASTNLEMLDWFARETDLDILTTKSIEVEPNPGNREPVVTEPFPGCFGNAVGLRNPGMEIAAAEFAELRRRWASRDAAGTSPLVARTPTEPFGPAPLLNISLSGSTPEQFRALARRLGEYADILELNFSCPHAAAGYGAAIGSDPDAVRSFVEAVKSAATVPVFVKLTPNVDDIAVIARAAVDGGVDGIVAINTVGPARYVEPHSGETVLTGHGGTGGMSGRWILPVALEVIGQVRAAIGPGLPIIGNGGVSSAEDAAAMVQAGADAVGVGSALASRHQREWPRYLAGLAAGTQAVLAAKQIPPGPATAGAGIGNTQGVPACPEPTESVTLGDTAMSYVPAEVLENEPLGGDIFELTLANDLDVLPGQALFLWIPAVGEKPFAPCASRPLRFLVKVKGPFTTALRAVGKGRTIYLRGPYGDEHSRAAWPLEHPYRVLMVVAGTGLAAVARLASGFCTSGPEGGADDLLILLGLRDRQTRTPLESLPPLATHLRVVYDDGVLGRVLDEFAVELAQSPNDSTVVYTAGPEPFMNRAIVTAQQAQVPDEAIFASVERTMLCGVGLCGACQCGGKLTCHHGTFVTAAALMEERDRDRRSQPASREVGDG
jgi:dihydroorotate dehydrogenase electron transfer subunit